jgi:hypothetical protein
LRGDKKRLGAATSMKSAYATMKLKNLMKEVTSEVRPETIDQQWIDSQALLAAQRTQAFHDLQENRDITSEMRFFAEKDIVDEYKNKGFDELNNEQINDLRQRISYKILIEQAVKQNEMLLHAPIRHGKISIILAYTPLAVSLFAGFFVLASARP